MNNLLPNPLGSYELPRPTLNLNQIDGFKPVESFVDEAGVTWTLSKAAYDSTKDVPDPKGIQFTDCWRHEFPGLKDKKVWVYVAEGIRPPRVETEEPARILYQWFSYTGCEAFNPILVTPREWLKANVYASPIVNARVSKLKAICHIPSGSQEPVKEEDKLLQVEELNDRGNTERDKD